MQPNGTIDINDTIAAWADIVIEKWHAKITELKVYDKGNLDDSLMQDLLVNSGIDIDKIEFTFKLYGIFVDMGVGKEISKGNSGDLGFTPERKAKEWFSRKYYGQIMKLREILMEQYSKAIAWSMINTLSADFDQRYASTLTANSVTNLRSIKYRQQNNSRTAKNYQVRRSQSGSWTNNHKTWKTD